MILRLVPLQDNFIGKVAYIKRKTRIIPVINGRSGLFLAKLHHLKLNIKKLVWGIIRVPYGKLKKSDLVSKLWNPDIKTIHLKGKVSDKCSFLQGCKQVSKNYGWQLLKNTG